ncbi:MAG: tetratricopeptide repeat protein [Patescibacteria group bacterium]
MGEFVRRITDRKYIILIICIGFVLYLNSLWNPFIWDDYIIIVDNPLIKTWNFSQFFSIKGPVGSNLLIGWYRPLLLISYSLDYHFWGLNPFGFHLINLLIHITSGVLVYKIGQRLTPNKFICFLASLFFIIHPIQTEAVSYISGRGDLFLVLSLLLSIWFLEKSYVSKEKNKKNRFYAFSIISFTGGLLSKETAIIFPVLVSLFFFSFLEEKISKISTKRFLFITLPYFLITFTYGFIQLINSKNWLTVSGNADIYKSSILSRSVMFLKAFYVYVETLIFPLDLHYRTETILDDSISDPRVLISAVILSLFLFTIIKFWKKKRIISFGLTWFLISLIPVSNIFIPLNFIIGLRWLYLGLIGFFIACASLFGELFNFLENGFFKKALISLLIIYLVFLSLLSIKRNFMWGNPITFFKQILKYDPSNYKIHLELGVEYVTLGNTEEAVREFNTSITLNPFPPNAYFNLGLLYKNNKDYENAIKYFEIAANKNFVTAYTELASIYAGRKDYNKALGYLYRLSSILPNSWKVYSQMGDVFFLKGDYENAELMWTRALTISPNNVEVVQKLNQIKNQ